MQLKVAKRENAFLRIGLFGASGSGKTFTALRLAHGLTGDLGKVVVVDTEKGSAALYSDHFEGFLQFDLEPPYSPERYIYAIKTCAEAEMPCLIIDSISHEWAGVGGCLDISASMSGNSFTNWAKITPRHNRFIDAILNYPGHVIACGRVKDDTVLTMNEKGKATPEKVGLKAVTRDGFDYEMTLAFDLAANHTATCSKDRTGIFSELNDAPLSLDVRHGEILAHWATGTRADELKKHIYVGTLNSRPTYLKSGDVEVPEIKKTANEWGVAIGELMKMYDIPQEAAANAMGVETLQGLSCEVLEKAFNKLEAAINEGII